MTGRAAPRRFLLSLVVVLAAWSVPAEAQPAARAASISRHRIVVFQFSSLPDDSSHRAFAATVARSLVHALVSDSAFHVMTHPRAARNAGPAAGDAQYGVIGSVADLEGSLSIEVRVLDLQHVSLLATETMALTDASSRGALLTATTALASRIRDRINAAPLP